MAVLKWNTPPTGTHEDRRSHIVGHGEGVALVHTAFGDHVEGQANVNTLGPNIELATKWSTAPYRGDQTETPTRSTPPNVWGYRSPDRAKRCMAHDDTCNAWATEASDRKWCIFHTPKAE